MLESQFQKKVKAILDAEIKAGQPLYYFVKEAKAIRGIPDIIGCWNGRFFAMELKRSESESRKTTGRIALQRYTLQRIDRAGGLGYIVHPDNLLEVLSDLKSRTAQRPSSPQLLA